MTWNKIAFFMPSLERGGIERIVVNLARGFVERGNQVDLVCSQIRDEFSQKIPEAVKIVKIGPAKERIGLSRLITSQVQLATSSLLDFISYLRREEPDVLLAMQCSVVAVWATKLAGVSTRLIVRESNTPSVAINQKQHWISRITPYAKRWSYPKANAIVTNSAGAKRDLARLLRLPTERINLIYNPTFDDSILEQAKEPVDHPWFKDDQPPVILGVGRLTRQKDFPTLLRAFARVRRELPARLVILGEGEDRPKLEKLAGELGVTKAVDMPGFVDNPYKYMARADLFVLSSRYEGMPNVLVEALAVGTPAVATDCPSGPREILPKEALVPVGDDKEMARKIKNLLENKQVAGRLLKGVQRKVDLFRPDTCSQRYIGLIEKHE